MLTQLPQDLDPSQYEIHRGMIVKANSRDRGHLVTNKYPRFDLTGATCLDVGACVGGFTRMCYDQGAGHVVACEPYNVNLHTLQLNAHYLGWSDRITIYDRAVSNKPELAHLPVEEWPTRKLYIPRGEDAGTASCCQQRGRQVIEVPMVDFQALINAHSPYLIKVAAEGIEYELFQPSLILPEYVRIVMIHFYGWREVWEERAQEIAGQFAVWGFQPASVRLPQGGAPGFGAWVR